MHNAALKGSSCRSHGEASLIDGAGASLASSGNVSAVNFAMRSRGASAMSLLLARQQPEQADGSRKPSGCLEVALNPAVNKWGDLWHVRVEVQLSSKCKSQEIHNK